MVETRSQTLFNNFLKKKIKFNFKEHSKYGWLGTVEKHIYALKYKLIFKYCCVQKMPAWRNGRRVWLKTSSERVSVQVRLWVYILIFEKICIKWMPKV